jgi:hypothetical protein
MANFLVNIRINNSTLTIKKRWVGSRSYRIDGELLVSR